MDSSVDYCECDDPKYHAAKTKYESGTCGDDAQTFRVVNGIRIWLCFDCRKHSPTWDKNKE